MNPNLRPERFFQMWMTYWTQALTKPIALCVTGIVLSCVSAQGQPLPSLFGAELPAELVPNSGTFYSAQLTNQPPLPCDPFPELSVYVVDAELEIFLIDDRWVDYDALRKERAALRELEAAALGITLDELYGGGASALQGFSSEGLRLLLPVWETNQVILPFAGGETNGVYDLFATTNLSPSAPGFNSTNPALSSLNGTNWFWMDRCDPTETNFTVWLLSDSETYYRLGTTNDSDEDDLTDAYENLVSHSNPDLWDTDSDGLPDGWEWKHFGAFEQTATNDFDGDGESNGAEYNGGTDPNTIVFATRFDSLHVSNTNVLATFEVENGEPAEVAVLVNRTNLTANDWQPYSSTINLPLGPSDGEYEIWMVLRGRAGEESEATWDFSELTLDRVPPVLVITNPTTATVIKPYLQLQGHADEPLEELRYDITNAAGLLTNQPAWVVDEAFDTNRFDFTTNWFQAYDVALTNGLNQITLTVIDRAGNETVSNISVTLDYTTATNPPVTELLWPPVGMEVSGDTFYLRGRINDETASVAVEWVDTYGVTNLISGLVERNGMFWVEGLPLTAGTNRLTLRARDAAGNLSTTNLSVVKSSMTLTIDSTLEGTALYEPYGTVTGTVSDSTASVTVNGVDASVYPSGSWTADNVPNHGMGTATFDAVATPSGGGIPTTVSVEKEMPAMVRVTKHLLNQTVSYKHLLESSESLWLKSYQYGFESDANGECRRRYRGEATSAVTEILEGVPGTSTTDYEWSDTNEVGTYHRVTYLGGKESGEMGPGDWLVKTVPDKQLDHADHYVRHCFAKGVRHRWGSPGDGTQLALSARTRMTLYTGGKAVAGRKSLISLTAWAHEYSKPNNAPWQYTPSENVDGSRIKLLGRPVGADYKLWAVQPDNAQIDLDLQVPGAKHINASLAEAKHKLRIQHNEFGDVTDKTSDTIVGRRNLLTAVFEPPISDEVSYTWEVPGTTVKRYEQYMPWTNSYTIKEDLQSSDLLSNAILFYWIDQGMGLQAICTGRIGDASLEAKAWFNINRPGSALTSITTTNNPSQVLLFQDTGWWLRFGAHKTNEIPGQQGITIYGSVTTPSNGVGTFGYLQLVDTLRRWRLESDDSPWKKQGSGCLDAVNGIVGFQVPIGSNESLTNLVVGDSPGQPDTGQDSLPCSWISADDSFTGYLMYQPTGPDSIWVSLRKIEWGWDGVATKSNGVWVLDFGSPANPEDPIGVDTVQLPTWSNYVATALPTVPDN